MVGREAEVWSDNNQSGSAGFGWKEDIRCWKAGHRVLMVKVEIEGRQMVSLKEVQLRRQEINNSWKEVAGTG